jgi:hypothetical protein
MSTAAVPSSSIYQELQAYFQQRGSDQQTLGKALLAGDLAGAQQAFTAIQSLGQDGPFASGDAYKVSQRQQDFAAVGQALQAGDLQGAQQAFAALQATFQRAPQPQQQQPNDQTPAVVVNLSVPSTAASGSSAASSSSSGAGSGTGPSAAAAGSEIVINLGNVTPGEQITIGVGSGSNGGEQVTIGVASQQGQAPEQLSFNLNPNSTQEIVLNLFSSATTSSPQSSGVSVTA